MQLLLATSRHYPMSGDEKRQVHELVGIFLMENQMLLNFFQENAGLLGGRFFNQLDSHG